MSRTETRTETWEVEVCETCGHDESLHHKVSRRIDLPNGGWYEASGCLVVLEGGRILPGGPAPNPYPRCRCEVFR